MSNVKIYSSYQRSGFRKMELRGCAFRVRTPFRKRQRFAPSAPVNVRAPIVLNVMLTYVMGFFHSFGNFA